MSASAAALVETLPDLPRDADGPVFREPWEAQAFAMAVSLHERGLFTWPEWAPRRTGVTGKVSARLRLPSCWR